MKQILAAGNIRLTKSLGQNFLHDGNQLQRIVEAAQLSKKDKVLEIGPGLGPLTELLVEQAGEVLAIEKDARLIEVLHERFLPQPAAPFAHPQDAAASGPGDRSGLHLIHDDALDYLRRERHDWNDWKLVANLPYSVASAILVDLALAGRGPQRIVVTLQSDVARRLTAGAGDRDYGVLTLLVQLEYEPRAWFKIPASCFFPEPEVDSACVCMMRREQPLLTVEQRDTFTRIVKRAFSQRRKMMLKLLREEWDAARLERALGKVGVSPEARAEAVSLEQFVGLARFLQGPKVASGASVE
jgi:16S rRNA (adenine1518-N6/adenine1519-N6)-dimethyltransferase